jgi:hypothetical protein
VSTSDRRARDEDRDAAIELVEAACAAGRIIEMDRDVRVAELRRAQTMAEIHVHTRDLLPDETAYEPGEEAETAAAAAPPPPVSYGPGPTGESRYPTLEEVTARSEGGKLPKAVFIIPFAAVIVVAVAIIGSLFVFTDVSEQVQEATGVDEGTSKDVLSAEGYADLVAAVQEQSGGTEAFDAVLYPEYAVVSLPVDDHTKRYRSWYWDGGSLATSSQGTASSPRFDMGGVDAAVLVDLVGQVQELVEDPTSWYVIVRAPDADGAMLWAYASNEFAETAYLGAKPDGTISYDSTETS